MSHVGRPGVECGIEILSHYITPIILKLSVRMALNTEIHLTCSLTCLPLPPRRFHLKVYNTMPSHHCFTLNIK